jgi:hypothetical protein
MQSIETVVFHPAMPAVRWVNPEDIVAEFVNRPGARYWTTPDEVREDVTDEAREFFRGWDEVGSSDVSAAVRSVAGAWGINPDEAPHEVMAALRALVYTGLRGE